MQRMIKKQLENASFHTRVLQVSASLLWLVAKCHHSYSGQSFCKQSHGSGHIPCLNLHCDIMLYACRLQCTILLDRMMSLWYANCSTVQQYLATVVHIITSSVHHGKISRSCLTAEYRTSESRSSSNVWLLLLLVWNPPTVYDIYSSCVFARLTTDLKVCRSSCNSLCV